MPRPAPGPGSQHYAGIVTRGLALAIDGAVAAALFAIGTATVSFAVAGLGVADLGEGTPLVAAGTLWLVFVSTYFVACWCTSGQTLGMRMMGVRVVCDDGEPPNLWRAVLRYFARLLSVAVLFTGYLLMLVHPQRRTLHDIIAGTFVVYADAPAPGVSRDAADQT